MDRATFSDLSQELLDEIVDFGLDHDGSDGILDASYFGSCALVCSSLRPRAQKHLFKTISLFGCQRITDLTSLLQRNRRLAAYIRILKIGSGQLIHPRGISVQLELLLLHITRYYPSAALAVFILPESNIVGTVEDRTTPETFGSSHMMFESLSSITSLEAEDLQEFPNSILLNLKQLRKLVLTHVTLDPAFYTIDTSRLLQLSLFFFCSLTDLTLTNMKRYPGILLLSCQALKTLVVENVTFTDNLPLTSRRPQIISLKVTDFDLETIQMLVDFLVDISCLKVLHDSEYTNNYQEYTTEQSIEHTLCTKHLLDKCKGSLETLNIHIMPDTYTTATPQIACRLSDLLQLTRLQVSCNCIQEEDHIGATRYLCELLQIILPRVIPIRIDIYFLATLNVIATDDDGLVLLDFTTPPLVLQQNTWSDVRNRLDVLAPSAVNIFLEVTSVDPVARFKHLISPTNEAYVFESTLEPWLRNYCNPVEGQPTTIDFFFVELPYSDTPDSE